MSLRYDKTKRILIQRPKCYKFLSIKFGNVVFSTRFQEVKVDVHHRRHSRLVWLWLWAKGGHVYYLALWLYCFNLQTNAIQHYFRRFSRVKCCLPAHLCWISRAKMVKTQWFFSYTFYKESLTLSLVILTNYLDLAAEVKQASSIDRFTGKNASVLSRCVIYFQLVSTDRQFFTIFPPLYCRSR